MTYQQVVPQLWIYCHLWNSHFGQETQFDSYKSDHHLSRHHNILAVLQFGQETRINLITTYQDIVTYWLLLYNEHHNNVKLKANYLRCLA